MKYRKQFHLLFSFSLLHIACSSCQVYEHGVSQQEKDQIVAKHNQLRQLIRDGHVPNQPRGIDLKEMRWDDYLAGRAQDIANTCVMEHRHVDDERFQVGQNLYLFSSSYRSGSQWDQAIQAWFDEHSLYKFGQGFSAETGHYTQVVWADTYLVGCGYTNYPINDGGLSYAQLYVCNYGPAGNYPTPPYKTG